MLMNVHIILDVLIDDGKNELKKLTPYKYSICIPSYDSKVLTLNSKGAIELTTGDELIAVLAKLKDAVLAGELDSQIEAASGALRAGFGK